MALVSSQQKDMEDVTFQQLLERYGTGQDITVVYEVRQGFNPSSRDWVGLYKAGSNMPSQYLAFEWAPMTSEDAKLPLLRQVNFMARYIHVGGSSSEHYQFLYVGRQGRVQGSSTYFLICDNPSHVLSALPPEVGPPAEQMETLPKDSLDDFEVIPKDPAPGELCVSLPARRIQDHISLSGSFDHLVTHSIDILRILDAMDRPDGAEMGNLECRASGGCEMRELKETELDEANQEVRSNKALDVSLETPAVVGDTVDSPLCVDCTPDEPDAGFKDLKQPQWEGKPSKPQEAERPAVDVNNNPERAVVPYYDYSVGSLAPVYNAFWQSHAIHECLKALPVPFVVPTRRGLKMRCQLCFRRKQEMRALKDKASLSVFKYSQLRKDFIGMREALDVKSALLEQLSDQIKHLVQENSSLAISNLKLADTKKSVVAVGQNNQRLLFEIKLSECKSERLEAENRALHLRKESLLGELESEERQLRGLGNENETLREDLESVRSQYRELERHLDDVMYTLSLQGYTGLVDTRGTTIDLTKASGNLVDLEGWNVTANKKTEKCLQRVKAQEAEKQQLEQTVEKLMKENQGLIEELGSKDVVIEHMSLRIKGLTELSESLKEDMQELEGKLQQAVCKNEESRGALLREKKNTSHLLRNHQDKVNELELRITSLQDCVHSATLNNRTSRKKNPTISHGNQTQVSVKTVSVQTSRSGQVTSPPPAGPCSASSPSPATPATGARPKHPTLYSPTQRAEAKTKRRPRVRKEDQADHLTETKYGLRSEEQAKPAVTFEKVTEVIPQSPWSEQLDVSYSSSCSESSSVAASGKQTTGSKKASSKKKNRPSFVLEYFSKKGGKKGSNSPARPTHKDSGSTTVSSYPGKVVKVNDLTCYHCGLTFLPGTDPNYIQRHIDSHGYHGF